MQSFNPCIPRDCENGTYCVQSDSHGAALGIDYEPVNICVSHAHRKGNVRETIFLVLSITL